MGRRLIVFTGTADFNIVIGDIANWESTVRDAFTNAGWDIVSVRLSKAIGNLFTNNITLTIEANVDESFTAEQARIVAVGVLQNINAGFLHAYTPLFTTIALTVLSDGQNPTSQSDLTIDNTLGDIYKWIGDTGKAAITGGASGLGGNIGLPIAIGAGFIFLVLLYGPRTRH